MKIDIHRLKEDRRALEGRIRSLKAQLRTTWTEPMGAVQRSLVAAKREATELCIVRAHLRGKLHLPDAERCKEVAERRMAEYRTEAGEDPLRGSSHSVAISQLRASEASGADDGGRGGLE
jgi:hypothetical protein